jgi:Zn-dependent peptidase ImmA (M78 family)/transcriptional regulator with XRE-family HTH domain
MALFNGSRLKLARIYCGMTTDELGEKLGISRQGISQFENRKNDPSLSTLISLASILHFPVSFFTQDDVNRGEDNVGSTYFRQLLTTSKKYQQEQIAKMKFVARIYSFLNQYVEFPHINLPNLAPDISPEHAAKSLRDFWNLGNAPITNIIRVMENNGIVVTSFKTSTDDVDAYSHKLNDLFIVVLSKNKQVAARTNFDAAHELGHILLHNWYEDLDSLSREEFKSRESEANAFASAFLLPKEAFRYDFDCLGQRGRGLERFVAMKQKWHVSIEALLYRARELDLITTTQYQSLYRLLHKKGWYHNEPCDDTIPFVSPVMLKSAVSLLLKENVFTPVSFMKSLGEEVGDMYHDQVEMLLDLPKGMLTPEVTYADNIVQLKR